MFILSPIFCRLGTGHHCRETALPTQFWWRTLRSNLR